MSPTTNAVHGGGVVVVVGFKSAMGGVVVVMGFDGEGGEGLSNDVICVWVLRKLMSPINPSDQDSVFLFSSWVLWWW
ncbi:hypothetical protein Hanom_Chr04g00315181 [Helianthus anomalus]